MFECLRHFSDLITVFILSLFRIPCYHMITSYKKAEVCLQELTLETVGNSVLILNPYSLICFKMKLKGGFLKSSTLNQFNPITYQF